MRPEDYAESITASRFCPSPEGDTPTSRRFYDAIAAGCIPILQVSGTDNSMWPFMDCVNYEQFAVIVPDDAFKTTANLIKLGFYLLKDLRQNEHKYAKMYRHLVETARPHLLYGGPDPLSLSAAPVRSMVADNMLRKASDLFRNAPYSCCTQDPMPRTTGGNGTSATTPAGPASPPEFSKQEGLARMLEQPTVLAHWPSVVAVPTHKYMVCEVPLTGASYLRILAILKDHTWLKATIVRHPIPRILASFLRQRDLDLNPETNPAPSEERYLFLDQATRTAGMDVAAEGDAFAGYIDGVLARFEGMSRITDMPVNTRMQVSFCGFKAHHVMYDHTVRWEQLGGALPQIFTSLGLWACGDLYDVTSCASASRGSKRLSTALPALLQRLASKSNFAQEQAVVLQYYTDDLLLKVAKIYSEDMSRFGFSLDDYKR
ncbi:MAG: hypothetical protein WDW38_001927 [Sanguina aurantia]